MSFAFKLGHSIGSAAASVVHGTRVGSSQLVSGTRQGYASKAEELIARRAQIQATAAKATAPAAPKATRRVKAA